MDPFEAVSSWIKRRFSRPSNTTPELPAPKLSPEYKIDSIWIYSHFREYLLNVSRHSNFLESIHNFPDVIELNSGWHDILNKMRHQTVTNELYSVISVNQTNQQLLLQENSTIANPGQVDHNVIQNVRQKVMNSNRVDHIIGDIHTHPTQADRYGLPGFSAEDMYCLIADPRIKLMTVIQRDENLFIFRTKETKPPPRSESVMSQEDFAKMFYEQNGHKYIKSDQYGTTTQRQPNSSNSRQLNVDIAAAFHIAFYIGKQDQLLKRIYPLKGVPTED